MNRRDFSKSVALSAIGFQFLQFKSAGQYTVDELMGRADIQLIGVANLRKEASEAFDEMNAAAQKAGLAFKPVSSFRSYLRQEQIWSGKYTRFTSQGLSPIQAIEKIIEYSTIPGTSRHHWGTDIDIVQADKPEQEDSLLARHFEPGGLYRDLKIWMDENKEKYGFYEVYTNNPARRGFKYEPWHLSYKPLSYQMLKEYKEIDLKSFLQKIKLAGSEHFTDEFIERYRSQNVLDINPNLL